MMFSAFVTIFRFNLRKLGLCSPMLTASTFSGTALIVDELRATRSLLRQTLDAMHYQVTEAADGLEAINLINESPFDIVFLDWELPGDLNGDHVARHLRTQPCGAKTLLIAITGDYSEKMRERCSRAGIHAFLGKVLDSKSVQSVLSIARQAAAVSATPAAHRIQQTLGVYAAAFPGGLSGALQCCREELTAEHERLRTAATEQRWADAARAAHNLGSLGSMVGIPELHLVARAAENALHAADEQAIQPALAHTNLVIDRTCLALNAPTE